MGEFSSSSLLPLLVCEGVGLFFPFILKKESFCSILNDISVEFGKTIMSYIFFTMAY